MGIWKSVRAGKLENSEINCRFENKNNPDSICIGLNLRLDTLDISCGSERRLRLCHLRSGKRLARLLHEQVRIFGRFIRRAAGYLDGRDGLPFVGREELLSAPRRAIELGSGLLTLARVFLRRGRASSSMETNRNKPSVAAGLRAESAF